MAEPVQLSRIAAIMLGVRDLPAAIGFYKDKLGLKVIMQESALALLQCGSVIAGPESAAHECGPADGSR